MEKSLHCLFPEAASISLEILQTSPSSLVLPAVDCKATRDLLSFLQASGDWNLKNLTNLDISQLEVNTDKPNLLVVQLQPLTSGLNEISTLEAIAENDFVVVLFKVFSAIYIPISSRLPYF
ncbi:UNVERIFIED_CONTAM: hypothetical protein H355_011119 [Colinus virginianus]|nr:hypothetical protein H355_011119 [Colinus virginianus]